MPSKERMSVTAKELHDRLTQAIIKGDTEAAVEAAEQALQADLDVMTVIKEGVIRGTDQLGELFQKFEIFLPELINGGDAAKAAMEILVPHIAAESLSQARPGKVIIATVFGDIHDIGKNLVGAMLAATGFEVVDMGVNVPAKEIVSKAGEVGANIIALSSLMSTSLYYQEDVIKYLKDSNQREKFYVVVGGGPVTPDWAHKIGADGCGRHASNAAEVCKRLVFESPAPPIPEPVIVW
jgi:trimethylamine corrinoid protein